MTTVSLSYPQTLVINQIYALPARACHMFADNISASGAIEFSNDAISWVSSPIPVHQAVGAAFIRATAANTIVCIKPID